MSRTTRSVLAAIVLMAAGGAVALAMVGRGSSASAADATAPEAPATAAVSRRDLVQREEVAGSLGYMDERSLAAAGIGTVTRLPLEGVVIERGQALYWIDGRPVTLMYGTTPAWRRLDASVEDGVDVRQLEQNLVALGYDPDKEIEIDLDWDSATTDAVERWQEGLGVDDDGAVEVGEIVFLPAKRRIGSVGSVLGAQVQPGLEVLATSSTRRVVSVDLDVTLQTLVVDGNEVSVELPDGATVPGTIVDIGRVAESATDAQGQQSDPTVKLEIRLHGGARASALDQAPVDVSIERERRSGVLTVPVGALVALAEGGYAVEVVADDGSTFLVAVEPGLFADGLVELQGDGLAEGTQVVVPS